MPDNEQLAPNLSSAVAQQGVADAAGGIAYSGVSDSSTAGEIAFQGPTADFILYGVVNGAFAQGPPDPTQNIEPVNNPLPYWYGPVQVSGGAITASWVTNSAYPSGQALRMTINAGAASDEAYFEQIIPVGGQYRQSSDYLFRATATRVSASGGTPQLTGSTQYLTAAGATTGSARTYTGNLSSDGAVGTTFLFYNAAPPTDAQYLRVRFGVTRNTMAAVDNAVIDFTDARVDFGYAASILGDIFSSTAPLMIYRSGDQLLFRQVDETFGWVMFDQGDRAINIGPGSGVADTGIYRAAANVLATSGGMAFSGVITPSIGGTVNDWAPTGISTCTVITPDLGGASRIITGIDATPTGEPNFTEGQILIISPTNSAASTLTLNHASGSSAAGNRFGCPNAANYVIPTGGQAMLIYLPSVNANNPFRVIGPVA